jgi:hypothetical protein
MSILQKIEKDYLGKTLFLLKPSVESDPWIRWMYVSADIDGIVQPPFPETFVGMRHATLRQTLDAFTTGEFIAVSEDPYKKPGETSLARVDPISAEFWQIRCVLFADGMRVIGAFADTDKFVGLYFNYREVMNYPEAVKECRETWSDLFPGCVPHSGKNLSDYLTGDYDAS